jgi:hypothetical protein
MSASNTWPEPETVLSRLEQIRLIPLRSHPDLWSDDMPASPSVDETPVRIPVRIVLKPAVAGHNQRESAWVDTRIDMTAPGCIDKAAKAAPGPQLNIYPRAHRSVVGRLLSAFMNRGR